MRTRFRQLVALLTWAVAAGLLLGGIAGAVALHEQEYIRLGWRHLAFDLLAGYLWNAAALACLTAIWIGMARAIGRLVLSDRRRARAATAVTLALTVGAPLLLYWRLPRLAGSAGTLPFFCDSAASLAVFLRRGLALKFSTGPLVSPVLWGGVAAWLVLNLAIGLLLGRFAPRSAAVARLFPAAGRRTAIAVLVVVLALAVPSLAAKWSRPNRPRAPNVLLISIDTLRADRLGCYGGPARTPNIDGLAARGVKIDNALSPSPWTLPAHAAMFCGQPPTPIGITDVTSALPRRQTTLAEALAGAGYRTAGFVTHLFVSDAYGFGQGFERLRYVPSERAADVVDSAISWIGKTSSPWFAFCHFFDAHWPYTPSREPAPPLGDANRMVDLLQTTDYARALRAAQADPTLARRTWLPRYDAEIEDVDAALGRLFTALSLQAERTVVVLVSDHGEAFGEYPTATDGNHFDPQGPTVFGHGVTCQPSVIRVPWIIAGPGAKSLRIDGQVDLTDLPALVLRLAGLRAQPSFSPLNPAWFTPEAGRPLVADTYLGGAPRYGVYCGRARWFTPVSVRYLDLKLDLPAVRQFAGGEDDRCPAQALAAYLSRARRAGAVNGRTVLSPDETNRLRSLGYVGDSR